jgi:energy-coupling factor transporter ATP-binding protein EcfA2
MLLEVKNLTFRYPGNNEDLWKPLNFKAGRGELVLLKGRNGSGKTTLLNCLCGIIPQAIPGEMTGVVLYQDKPLTELSLKEIAPHINLLFQEPDKQIFMPVVEEEIVFGPENLCIEREEIGRRLEYILQRFRIGHLRQRKTAELSFGQKKLTVLAGLLAISPQVLLIDEFSAGMEENIISLFVDYLEELKKEGKLIIAAEHPVYLEQSADMIINLDEHNSKNQS